MESIKELREICQAGKVEKSRQRYWWYLVFGRYPSIYITRLLLPLPITPNAVSIISIILGLAGVVCFLQPSISSNILGTILIYFYWLLDKVDGEIARYKNLQSLQGKYLDEVAHFFLPGLFFFALGIRVAPLVFSAYPIILGMFAGLSSMGIRFVNFFPSLLIGKKALKYKDIYLKNKPEQNSISQKTSKPSSEKKSLVKHLIRFYHQFQTLFVINALLFIVLLGSYLNIFSARAALDVYLLVYAAYLFLNLLEELIKKYYRLDQETKRELKKIENS